MRSRYSRGDKFLCCLEQYKQALQKGTALLYRCQRGGLLFRNPPDNSSSSFMAGDIPDTFPSLAAKVKTQNLQLDIRQCQDVWTRPTRKHLL